MIFVYGVGHSLQIDLKTSTIDVSFIPDNGLKICHPERIPFTLIAEVGVIEVPELTRNITLIRISRDEYVEFLPLLIVPGSPIPVEEIITSGGCT